MRNFGIYGGFCTVLTLCSLAYGTAANAEIMINPYPDVPKAAPVAMVQAPMKSNFPATEFTDALEQAAMETQGGGRVQGFDIEAYYNRFENASGQAPEVIMPMLSSQPEASAADIMVEKSAVVYNEDQYVQEIEKAKQDLAKIKVVAEAELKNQATQIEALRAEKMDLERQAADVAALRTEKAALEQRAAQVETLMTENQALEQEVAQVAALRMENASLEQKAAKVAVLRAEKVALEKRAAEVDTLRAEKVMLVREAAKVASLRAENVSLAKHTVKLEAMRTQQVSSEMQVARADVLQAEKDLLARKLEKAQGDFQALSAQGQEANVQSARLEAEKALLAHQLQLAQKDYRDMSSLEQQVSMLKGENQLLKKNFDQSAMNDKIIYERFASLEPASGHPAALNEPTGLYARASSQGQHVTSSFQPSSMPRQSAATLPYWTAPEGMRVKDVLGHWSRQQEVTFVWDTDNQFLVTDAFEIRANYEDAVAELLGKYMGRDTRPVGSLHLDPDNGQRVLVVQTTGRH